MKKIMMCIIVLTTLVGLLCACGGNANDVCSISGCNNQVYKDGLCPDHYVAAQSVPKDDDLPDTQAEENKDVDSLDLELDEDILEESKNDVEDHEKNKMGLRNMKVDSKEWELSPEQKLVVRYFDNDYFMPDYSAFRKYPDLFEGVQVEEPWCTVMKVISQDDKDYELLASWAHYYAPDEVGDWNDGYNCGINCVSMDPNDELVILKGSTTDQYYMEKENIYVKGRCVGLDSVEIDGVSYVLPIIETYTLNEKFSYEEIKAIAEGIFGNQISISKDMYTPSGEEVMWLGDEPRWYGDYEIKLDNQKNVKFDSYLMSEDGKKFTNVLEGNTTVKRNLEFAPDFNHFFLFSYDSSVNNLTLEYYDKEINMIWKREFLDTTIATYDFTGSNVYLVANGYLYILDAETGEDSVDRSYVGEKIDIRKINDGLLLFGEGTSEAVMKTDNVGNILWTVNPKNPIQVIRQVQFVDNKVIVEFDALDASVEMELDSNTREYLMIDVDTGEILKEIESIIYS